MKIGRRSPFPQVRDEGGAQGPKCTVPPILECFSLGDKHIPPFIQERSCHLSVLDDFVVLGKMQPDVDCVSNRVVLHDKPDDLDFIE